jgi:hypothetical protein
MFFYRKLLYNFDMLRELQALAKMAEEDDRQPSERVNKLVAGMSGIRNMGPVGLGATALIPLGPAVRHLIDSTSGFRGQDVPKTRKQLQDLVNKLEKGQGLGKDISLRTVDKPGQSEYRRSYPWAKKPWQELKLSPKSNPLTVGHEFGHAIQKNKAEKALNITSGLARHPLALALPSILALSGGLGDDEEAPLAAKAAPYLGGAQLASIFGEETRANIRSLKLLKEKGIPLTTLQKLRQFVPSLSYLGRGALLVGAPLGILAGMKSYEQSRKSDYPYTMKQLITSTPKKLSETPTPEEVKEKWSDRIEH